MLNSRYFLGDIAMMEQDHRACNGPVRIAPIDDKPSVDLADITKMRRSRKQSKAELGAAAMSVAQFPGST
jgi:hypothetical protein